MLTSLPRQPVERLINSTKYRVRPLGARKGCQVLTRITKLLGATFKSGGFEGMQPKDLTMADAFRLLGAALAEVSEQDFAFLCNAFAEYTDFQGPEDGGNWPPLATHFDNHFSANYDELLEWLYFCLELNFLGFFDQAKAALAKQAAAKQAMTSTPKSPSAPDPAAAT